VPVVYSSHYDISFFGLERLHPFDSRKYGRSWRELKKTCGQTLREHYLPVDRAANEQELLHAHSAEYLQQIKNARALAAALEVPILNRAPVWLTWWRVVQPMLWAVRGTILAAEAAVKHGWAVNLSGGYHHAKPNRGEGFSLFNDIAIAIRQLRTSGTITSNARIAYVDLDAHQGNGVCHQFLDDREVFIFDMYNRQIYPAYDLVARQRIDCDIPLMRECQGTEYLEKLRDQLPGFLDGISRSQSIALGVYNAGTDVLAGDPLGGLSLSAADILERDLFVMNEFRRRKIPVVMLPSGGYTAESYRLIAASVRELLR
jgi:histone deacetylase 11